MKSVFGFITTRLAVHIMNGDCIVGPVWKAFQRALLKDGLLVVSAVVFIIHRDVITLHSTPCLRCSVSKNIIIN